MSKPVYINQLWASANGCVTKRKNILDLSTHEFPGSLSQLSITCSLLPLGQALSFWADKQYVSRLVRCIARALASWQTCIPPVADFEEWPHRSFAVLAF